MKNIVWIATFALLVICCNTAVAEEPVQVFITIQGNEMGIVSPDHERLEDSTKDIVKSLRKAKEVRLVGSAAEAQVVLTVMSSKYEPTNRKQTLTGVLFGGNAWERPGDSLPTIRAILKFGTYEAELIGQEGPRWASAAKGIANQVKDWSKANAHEIVARQQNTPRR